MEKDPKYIEELSSPYGDPVFCDTNDMWNFWDETWANFFGPYASEEEARMELKKYTEGGL